MAKTLLQLIQTAADELGLARPAAAISDTSAQTRQLVAFANKSGELVMQRHDWTALQTEWPIAIGAPVTTTGDLTVGSTVVANIPSTAAITAGTFSLQGAGVQIAARVASVDGATQITMTEPATASGTGVTLTFVKDTFALPSDFERYISDTWWDRTNHWKLIGPITPQLWQWQLSGIVQTGPRRRWRQIGRQSNAYRIWPPPSSSDTPAEIVFEYISRNWATDTNGTTTKSSFTADTDTCVFDDGMMVSGIKWQFFQIKGFAYDELKRQWENLLDSAIAHDGGATALNLGRRGLPYLITSGNVQDGNFPAPS